MSDAMTEEETAVPETWLTGMIFAMIAA